MLYELQRSHGEIGMYESIWLHNGGGNNSIWIPYEQLNEWTYTNPYQTFSQTVCLLPGSSKKLLNWRSITGALEGLYETLMQK